MQLFRCTLLVIFVGSSLSIVACGDEKSSAPTSGTAGLVLAAQGEVNATRLDQTPRLLKPDDDVYVDDTVRTSKGGSVEILLHHNNVRWALSEGEERRIDGSAAWRAEKQSASRYAPTEKLATAAAGAHTERRAAEPPETVMGETVKHETATVQNNKAGSASTTENKGKSGGMPPGNVIEAAGASTETTTGEGTKVVGENYGVDGLNMKGSGRIPPNFRNRPKAKRALLPATRVRNAAKKCRKHTTKERIDYTLTLDKAGKFVSLKLARTNKKLNKCMTPQLEGVLQAPSEKTTIKGHVRLKTKPSLRDQEEAP